MKTRFVPANAETREFPGAAVVAYCYDSARGPAYIAYKGRRTKPLEHYAFPDAEKRDAALLRTVVRESENEAIKAKRTKAAHGLKVGDILYSMWGYEQTNVDFYQVVRVPSERSAVVRAIKQDRNVNGYTMTGTTTAIAGAFLDNAAEQLRRAVGAGQLSGGRDRASLSLWDGRPKAVSTYA